ncbi:MAG: CDP-glucose 4,6-dehydratase [Thermoplasmatales archaeon]
MSVDKFFKGKKILITGHTGFIGSWMTKWLTMLGANVCGYSLNPPTQPNLFDIIQIQTKIKHVIGDIRNGELFYKTGVDFQPEIVYHLAAQPIVLSAYKDPVETFDINVTGTVNVLNSLRKIKSVKTILVMTSDKSYLNKEWEYPYREIDELGGIDPYSASKSCQDIVVNSFRESYFEDNGVSVSSVRAGNAIGGGDWAAFRIVPDIVKALSKNEPVKIRNPSSVRPWQHVLDPIAGIFNLTEKMWDNSRYSGAWNFGPAGTDKITVKDLVDQFISLWNDGSYDIENISEKKEANYLTLDISRAVNLLNWHPVLDINRSLKLIVEWYKGYLGVKANMDLLTENQISLY